MKLIKFRLSKKKIGYVNPDHVISLVPYGEEKTLIRTLNAATIFYVLHNIEEVASMLIGDIDLEIHNNELDKDKY